MATGGWLELDLLQRRRQQLGLQAPKPVQAKPLLIRGGLVGGACLLLAVLLYAGALLYRQMLEGQQARLAPIAAEFDQAQARLGRANAEHQALEASNQKLATAIAGVRSGSALLTELAALVPRGMQFTKLKVLTDQVELQGLVNQPMGLALINGLQLQLSGSPFFLADKVALVKASEQAAAATPTPGANAASAAPLTQLSFELKAPFANDDARLTRNRLLTLGSVGLAKRIQLLRGEGLLP